MVWQAGGRAYGQVITKFSWMARLLHFPTLGASLHAARESFAKQISIFF